MGERILCECGWKLPIAFRVQLNAERAKLVLKDTETGKPPPDAALAHWNVLVERVVDSFLVCPGCGIEFRLSAELRKG